MVSGTENHHEISPELLKHLYESMQKIRRFEEHIARILEKQEKDTAAGILNPDDRDIKTPIHLYIGQEAIAAGVCANLVKDDYVFSTHRSHGHYLAKGGDLNKLAAEIFCKVTGSSRGRGGSMHIADSDAGLPGSSAIVGGTIPLAVGAALAISIKKKENVAVAFFGDGAAAEGVLYESMNLAALMKLPVIFVCENNLYATHMPIAESLGDTGIFKKAAAFGLPGGVIEGNDVTEVFRNSRRFIENARKGGGPAFLECMTYRWRGHVGPNYDLDKWLRSKEELDYWMAKCPIKTFEESETGSSLLSESERNDIITGIDREIEEAISDAMKAPYPDSSELLDFVYKTPEQSR